MSNKTIPFLKKAFGITITLYIIWVFFTWLFEGRVMLLQNPDPIGRVVYALVANIFLGTLITIYILRLFFSKGVLSPPRTGFRPIKYTAGAIILATVFGTLIYTIIGFPTSDPVLFLNGFAQVLPTSIAEVLVCWTAVGMTIEKLVKPKGNISAIIMAIVISTVLFGVYHIAHSPPFNSPMMIVFLMLPGFATAIFYFAVREIYSAIIFQNFMGTLGVLQNVDSQALMQPNFGAITLAVAAIAILLLADYTQIRRILKFS